jgi:hypothetical protein
MLASSLVEHRRVNLDALGKVRQITVFLFHPPKDVVGVIGRSAMGGSPQAGVARTFVTDCATENRPAARSQIANAKKPMLAGV